ncbi:MULTISPECIES: FAD-binding oxidoreductase [Azospirillum]|uniref:FAD-binding oxidoreductase n=1 Tax=Azospirillum TaxID=191 RepID=UPI0014797464|nr:FAD-binding oxidoreductase [Azospirillum sp. NL1]MDW5532362.1 FAD-binding oxidoreductase [Azospirillum sp. NL1]
MGIAFTENASRLHAPAGIACSIDGAELRSFASDGDTPQGHVPRAVLKPRSTDEILSLIRWANDSGTGVVPVSSTGRRRRGDTVPARDNVVIADLSGMNRLLHADARDKIAILEAGVDFGTVDDLLQPHGLRALRPLSPRAGKSVLASFLEREPPINANDHWDVADPFGGTLLVLGNGHCAPTGGAAIEGTLAEQLARGHRQMMPIGPTNLDLLRVLQGAQGSLGLMAWAALYCERIPTMERGWFASADALEPVIDLARELLHHRIGNALFIVDRVQLALLLARDAAAFNALCGALPAWTLFVGLSAGRQAPEEKMAWQQADLRAGGERHGVGLAESLAGHTATALGQRLRVAEPVSFRDRVSGAHRELFFLQQLDRAAGFVPLVRDGLTKAGLGHLPLGVYIQPMAQGVYGHIEFTLPYDPDKADDAQRSAAAWQAAAERCADAGAFFSRPYGAWSDLAYRHDDGIRSMMALTKSILDPAGVMNPNRLPYS